MIEAYRRWLQWHSIETARYFQAVDPRMIHMKVNVLGKTWHARLYWMLHAENTNAPDHEGPGQ